MSRTICPKCNSSDVSVTKSWTALGCPYGIEGDKKRAKTLLKQVRCRSCGKSFRVGELIEVITA
ncbi:MAG: hypothetical protein JRN52_10880 [Nitrososphaerota archaeon]|nr:hypothetical protein [Nitrososphaerota archaeon]